MAMTPTFLFDPLSNNPVWLQRRKDCRQILPPPLRLSLCVEKPYLVSFPRLDYLQVEFECLVDRWLFSPFSIIPPSSFSEGLACLQAFHWVLICLSDRNIWISFIKKRQKTSNSMLLPWLVWITHLNGCSIRNQWVNLILAFLVFSSQINV